ncbi:MAG: xanthine dehydrogenase family protein subunit M, partial [Thermoleophilia bacterium]
MEGTLQPATLDEALAARAAHPEALPLAGGTDLMVEMNFGRRRPERIMDLTRLRELEVLEHDGDDLVIGAGVTHTRLVAELGVDAPGLAIAARTVGSPQIRNRGTIGGNLGTASPAGDALPPLLVERGRVEIASVRGART